MLMSQPMHRNATKQGPRLRPYQVSDLHKIGNAFRQNRRICYQGPTGSGKTVLAAEFIDRQPDNRIIVLGHRDEIVQQISQALLRLGIEHGIIAPGHADTNDRVQVASVMTLVRRMHQLDPPPSLLVIDEAHHAVAKTWQRIIDALPDTDILGLTATPRRLDGKPLDDIFDELVVGPSIAKLIDDGYLAPVTVFTPPDRPNLDKVQIRAGDYAIDQLGRLMSGTIIVDGAVSEYERLCANAPAIAFCVDIAHSKLVTAAFRDRGYRAEHLDGNAAHHERRALIHALTRGTIDVLSNCGLISEGLDVPGVECVIGLRPTRSLALYLQMVGRAVRPGKAMAFVLDHAGNVYRHGLPTAQRHWSLHDRLHVTDAGDGLRRCPECGAVNPHDAQQCIHCGVPLPHRQRANIVVPGRPLTEAIESPVTDADLAAMSYRAALLWATDADGRLITERLERIAMSRGYKQGWVYHQAHRTLDAALQEFERWRRQGATAN
jgi:superfamily II DNA or RNA helicase